MRERAFIHVDGSPGAGKTTFIERLLKLGLCSTCIRCIWPGGKLRREELERYSQAGALTSASYRLKSTLRGEEEFFEIDAMRQYSQVVLIEGATPTRPDLSVFVTSPSEQTLLTKHSTRWVVSPYYHGIEKAEVVVVNLFSEDQRPLAAHVLEDIQRLRQDPEVFRDAIGFRASKRPITSVSANLSDPKDAGLKKALVRVKRAWTRA